MKTIKLALVAVALLVVASSVSFAQGGGGGGGGGGGRAGGGGRGGARGGVGALLMGVADSATVAAKATEINTKYMADIAAGRPARGGAAPADSLVKKAADATTARNKEIRALLTKPADQAAFDKNVAASMAPRGGGF